MFLIKSSAKSLEGTLQLYCDSGLSMGQQFADKHRCEIHGQFHWEAQKWWRLKNLCPCAQKPAGGSSFTNLHSVMIHRLFRGWKQGLCTLEVYLSLKSSWTNSWNTHWWTKWPKVRGEAWLANCMCIALLLSCPWTFRILMIFCPSLDFEAPS